MGVHGLWQLISSTGKPVPLESLEGKVLAVDVSVWLHQLSKGMRDGAGNSVPNAHLHGLFTRICKLIHCRIKPVFVFDGGVPALKKQTLANRKSRRDDAEKSSEVMQQKILTNLIRSQVLQAAAGDAAGPIGPYYNKPKSKTDKDMLFQLPPMSETSQKYLKQNSHQEDDFIERRELQAMIEEEYEDVNQIDVDSEEFKSLPSELQHEIIYDIQQNRKNYNMSKIAELPSDSNDFSSYQLSKVLKHSKLHSRLEEVRKEMNSRQTQDLSKHYNLDIHGANATSHRLVSDERSHVLLIKGLKNKSNVSEVEEKKRKLEMEKREKNMKLLEKVFPELSEGAGNSIIQPPDEEIVDVKQLDIIKSEHKDVDEQGISNDNNSLKADKGARNIGESSRHHRIENKASDITRKKADDKPARYRPVIEMETDSSDESVDDEEDRLGTNEVVDGYEKSMFTDRVVIGETIVINDDEIDSEDEEMQLAIALSLQQTAGDADRHTDDNNHEHPDLTVTDFNVKPPRKDNSYNAIIEENVSQGMVDSDKLSLEPEEISFKQGKDQTRKTDTKKNLPLKVQTVSKQGRKLENDEGTLKLTGESIFKRHISNSSNDTIKEDDDDDEPVRRRIIRTGSEESNGVRDEDECSKVVDINPSEVADDSEDDFIEVKIDPDKVKEDELFPPSMFALDVEKSEIEKTHTLQEDKNLTERRENDEKSDTESVDQRVDVCVSPSSNVSNNDEIKDSTDKDKTIGTEDIEEVDEPIQIEKVERSLFDEEKENSLHGLTDEIQGTNETAKAISDEMAEKVVYEGEDDDVLESAISEESVNVESVVERPESPKVPDLVKKFQAMDERNIRGLAKESRQLQQERGRQERLAMSITDQMHSEAQELLKLFGIPYIVSPTEAEAQCAQLDFSKQTQGTITDDSDIWLFGGKCVYKNFFNQQKYVECFRLDSIQNKLGLTRQTLINIALLCGSDYTHGIQGVGPVTAMEILAEFPGQGIEALTKFRSWWDTAQKDIKFRTQNKLRAKLRELELNEGFPQPQVVDAYLNPVVDNSSEKLTWGTPDLEQLRQFAIEKLGWTKEKVDETLQPVLKRINDKQNQMRISAYFQPETHMQPAKMKSKRLQNVVTKFLNPDAAIDINTTDNVDKTIAKAKSEKQKRRKFSKKSENIVEEIESISDELNEDMEDPDKSDTIESGSKIKKAKVGKVTKTRKGKQMKNKVTKDSVTDTKSTETRRLRAKAPSVQYVEDSETSGNTESDSASDSEEDNSSDGGVVETSLNVSEILGMNIGPNLQQCAKKDKEAAEGGKVFVSGLNLDEILNLKSDDTMDENMLERWDSGIQNNDSESETTVGDHRLQEAVAQVCLDEDDSDYTNEGGFCKDNSDDDHKKADEAEGIKVAVLQTRMNTRPVSGKKNISEPVDEPQEEKRPKRQTRSSKLLSDTSTVNKIPARNRNLMNSKVLDDGKLKGHGNKSIRNTHEKNKTYDKAQSLGIDKSEKQDDVINSGIKDCEDLDEPPVSNVDVKKEVPVYASNPLKRLATGVPWEHRSTKRGRLTKGSGKGKAMHVEPKEKLQRKKENGKQTRKAIGVVNLSESSSDSN